MDKLNYTALRETICHSVLSNGLNIYVDERPEYGKQFAFFATRYGGMDLRFRGEDASWIDTPQGVAHFLEHKMFDTKDGSALQRMAAQGVDPNAYTTPWMTGYFFEGTQGFEDNLRTLLSFVSQPWFTAESVEKEQGIIAQEIRMCEDDPDHEVYYQLMEAMYAHHPIRIRVAGTVESIASITADTLYQCHKAFYRPGNMVLCAAGSVDPQRVEDIAREVLEQEPSSAAVTDRGMAEPPGVVRKYAQKAMAVSISLFEIGFKGEPAPKGEGLRQRLLAGLVCDVLFSASAPLYSRLYEQGLINGSFDSGFDMLPGCAFLTAGGESRDPQKVLDEVLKEAERLGREGINPALWDRLKKASYGVMVRQLNSLEGMCFELAQAHFEGEDFLRFPECFQSIERCDAEELLRTWCVESRAALSVIVPEG